MNTTTETNQNATPPVNSEAARCGEWVGDDDGYRPKDRLKTVRDERNVNRWYLVTESDDICIGMIECIVGEGFARGLVESWNRPSSAAGWGEGDSRMKTKRQRPTLLAAASG